MLHQNAALPGISLGIFGFGCSSSQGPCKEVRWLSFLRPYELWLQFSRSLQMTRAQDFLTMSMLTAVHPLHYETDLLC